MKRVGVREFHDHVTKYLAGSDVLAVERHGKPIGFYIPAQATSEEELTHALERLEQAVGRVLERTGMTEDELSRIFDVNQPDDALGD